MAKKSFLDKFESIDRHTMAHFYLGIGVTIFILNVVSYMSIYVYFKDSSLGVVGPYFGHYSSFVAAILLIVFSIYEMNKKK
jgi:hypothetical protein